MAKHNDKNRGKGNNQGPRGPGSQDKGQQGHVHGPDCNHDDNHDHENHEEEVPEGVALLPEVPDSLGLHPFSLAILDTVVFLTGTDEELMHQGAADEMFGRLIEHLNKLQPAEKQRFHDDLNKLGEYGRSNGWEADAITFLTEMATLLIGNNEK